MSIIKDINDLHITLRFLVLFICFTSPFFYLDIYFLKNSLFISAPNYLLIVMAFCMSIAWYFGNSICISGSYFINKIGITDEAAERGALTVIISTLLLMFISLYCIYYKVNFGIFFRFIVKLFIIRFIVLVITNLKPMNEFINKREKEIREKKVIDALASALSQKNKEDSK